MKQFFNQKQKIYYTLRIASAMCCIGHGAWGIITKPIWCNYFAVFGIGHDLAYQLMPLVGFMDIMFGISILLYPTRAVLTWLVIWGFITATLRPLSGEPFAEMIERAGNFGAPLALLLLTDTVFKKKWFERLNPVIQISNETYMGVMLCLRVIVFLLIAGHGWLNLIEKKGLIEQYTRLGFSNPWQVASIVGIIEIAFAFSVLFRPVRAILIPLLIWKMTSELFYPQHELLEWVERGGSYGSVLALLIASHLTSYGNWLNKSNVKPFFAGRVA